MQTLKWVLESRALKSRTLTLDGCDRCGGLWLEAGVLAMAAEVQRSGVAGSERLGGCQVRVAAVPMVCHQCSGMMGRNLANCPSCGWQNRIACPVCALPMERKSHGSLVIDECSQCQGIWLDRVELSTIGSLSRSLEFYGSPTPGTTLDRTAADTSHWGGEGLARLTEVALHTPEVGGALGDVVAGLEAAPEMATGAVELLVVGVEGAGAVASVVIEAIAGILAGLLGG